MALCGDVFDRRGERRQRGEGADPADLMAAAACGYRAGVGAAANLFYSSHTGVAYLQHLCPILVVLQIWSNIFLHIGYPLEHYFNPKSDLAFWAPIGDAQTIYWRATLDYLLEMP